ncbi:MAG TPA: tol-pal system protein YbgF [Thermodesulfobacteriota bacterium]
MTAALTGCAGMKEQQKAIDQLNVQVSDLKTSLGSANSRIDDLGNRLTLLHEKTEASRAEIEKLAAQAVPAAPPEGLKVVPLAEEPALKYNPGPMQRSHTVKETMLPAQDMYNKGQDLFMAGRYGEAREAFAAFLKAYPRHSLSDNALYWMGEAYYTEKDFEKALEKFAETADKYPEENKTPDALLKAGFSNVEMNRPGKAREYFERLLSGYPSSGAAAKARGAIEGLKGER